MLGTEVLVFEVLGSESVRYRILCFKKGWGAKGPDLRHDIVKSL